MQRYIPDRKYLEVVETKLNELQSERSQLGCDRCNFVAGTKQMAREISGMDRQRA